MSGQVHMGDDMNGVGQSRPDEAAMEAAARKYAPDMPPAAPGVSVTCNEYQRVRRMAFAEGASWSAGQARAQGHDSHGVAGDHPVADRASVVSERTLRERLGRAICAVTDTWDEPLDEVVDVPQVVNAVLAEGLSPTGEQWDSILERMSESLDETDASWAVEVVRSWLAEVAR